MKSYLDSIIEAISKIQALDIKKLDPETINDVTNTLRLVDLDLWEILDQLEDAR